MRKPVQKIVALCCVGAMALCFASCKPDSDAKESTTENTTVADVSEVSTEESTEASTAAGDPAGPTDAPSATGIAKPANVADGVKLYNDALAKKGAVTATVTRSLDSGKALIINLLDLGGVKEAFDLTDAPLEGADLYKLDASNVANVNVTESGDNYVMDFTLNNATGDASSVSGHAGFMYILDYQNVADTIMSIGKALGGDSFELEVKELKSMELSNGKLTVTVNKTTGKLSSVVCSFTETLKASVKSPALANGKMAVDANVQGSGTVKYTVA